MSSPRRSPWSDWAAATNAAIRGAGRWREPRALDGDGVTHKLDDGRVAVSFASNDYLGLSQHPLVVAAAHDALDRWGAGSGSARLIVGARPIHDELEAALAAWKSEAATALFPTGFMANLGAMSALGGTESVVYSDELNHASIIDGCRSSRSEIVVYPHADLDALVARLGERGGRRALVVTDTVFSMDGDSAELDALCEICARHDALLVLDEAHAVLGPEPSPAALAACDHLRVGTLSKTLGSLGGFVAGPAALIALLVNRARPYIFTTALTPADAAAALAAVRIVDSPAGAALVGRLRANVDRVRPDHPSPIIPVVCGSEQRAVAAAAALLERGVLVPAIRPPTVAPGTARLRVTLSAAHSDAQIDQLLAGLDALDLR
jgi:8-amino-7-oxononanoate synthase